MKKVIFSLAAAIVLVPLAISAQTAMQTNSFKKLAYSRDHHGKKDIIETAMSAKMFSTLIAAIKAADLVKVLKGPGKFTVFAPTDEAFAKLPKGTVEKLLKPENKDMLIKILTYHVVSGDIKASKIASMKKAKTLQGQDIMINVKYGIVWLNGKTKVIKTDIGATNGTIHAIDSVLMPPM